MARESKRKRDEKRFGKAERLADMLYSSQWKHPAWCEKLIDDPEFTNSATKSRAQLLELVATAKLVVADNVSEYFYANNPKENWIFSKDFPCCVPSFPRMFIEFTRPSCLLSEGKVLSSSKFPNRWGWFLEAVSREDMAGRIKEQRSQQKIIDGLRLALEKLAPQIDAQAIDAARTHPLREKSLPTRERTFLEIGRKYLSLIKDSKTPVSIPEDVAWFVCGDLFIADLVSAMHFGIAHMAVDINGQIIDHPAYGIPGGEALNNEKIDEYRDALNVLLMAPMMTLSFMHCKNVVIEPVNPPADLNRERKKAGLKPFLRYHTINIEPMKKVLRTEGNIEANGLKRALHICRGHFSHYSEEKPLFGRIAGTFWIPSHVRGSAKEGVVISDYNVKAPKVDPQP